MVPKLFGTRDRFHGRQFFHGLPTAHLLLCGLIPNRLRTGTRPWPRGWVPLIYTIFLDSTYMRYYTIFAFLFLTYFTLNDALKVHPRLYK